MCSLTFVAFAALLARAENTPPIHPGPVYAMHPNYNAIIVCDEPVSDIGTIWAGPDIQARFPIRNDGTGAAWIKVSSCTGTCAPCITSIEPGDTVYVPVTLRSTRLHRTFAKHTYVSVVDEPAVAVPACFGVPGYSDWCIRYSETD